MNVVYLIGNAFPPNKCSTYELFNELSKVHTSHLTQMFSMLQLVPVFVVVNTFVASGLATPGETIGCKYELTSSNSRITEQI